MTVKATTVCDAPHCGRTTELRGGIFLTDMKVSRERAASIGWNTTRVPNPYPVGNKTVVLDRCPEHAKTLLRVEVVDDLTYRVVLKEAR